MAYHLIVKEEALTDTIEAFKYYEEKSIGLGEQFLEALQERYNQISENPQYFGFISADREKTLRDVKIKKFPYAVIYDYIEDEVTIYAVHNFYRNRKEYLD
jgi:hypothetical protein